MKYYDSSFRKSLSELLISCRKMLQQAELSSTDKNYTFFITDMIKKVDEACKIISPSPFDFLTEKKLEKLQSDEFLRQKADEYDAKLEHIRKDVADELREKLQKEIIRDYREKLTEEIQEKVIKDYREKLIAQIQSELEPEIEEKVIRQYREQLIEEIRAELEPKIKAELKEKKRRKKERREAKALERIQSELLHLAKETQPIKGSTEPPNETQFSETSDEESFEEDDFDVVPDFESIE